MKLVSVTFKSVPRMPGIRADSLCTVNLERPPEALKNWRISIRGQQVFFISPPGWLRDQNIRTRDIKGPVTIFEVPRAEACFEWQATTDELDAFFKGGKYESDPLGWTPPPPAAAPAAATAPTAPAGELGDA